MSDDLRDKFSSDDEYDEFRNSYDDYKNGNGMFDSSEAIKEIIEFQQLLYNSFIVENKKYIRIPEKYIKVANLPLYVFYCETLPDTLILNMN